MTGGIRGRGFFAGAVGGLALALLLVGVASFLPQSNPIQTEAIAGNGAQAMAALASTTSTTTAVGGAAAVAASNSTCSASQPCEPGAPQSSVPAGAASSQPPQALSTMATPSGASAANGALQQVRPSSLLVALPRESVGTLIATISPLLVGLLVAALVYGAYVRRQDSSS